MEAKQEWNWLYLYHQCMFLLRAELKHRWEKNNSCLISVVSVIFCFIIFCLDYFTIKHLNIKQTNPENTNTAWANTNPLEVTEPYSLGLPLGAYCLGRNVLCLVPDLLHASVNTCSLPAMGVTWCHLTHSTHITSIIRSGVLRAGSAGAKIEYNHQPKLEDIVLSSQFWEQGSLFSDPESRTA